MNFSEIQTLVALDGELPPADFFKQFPNARLIAADGAAWALFDRGLHPHHILGDMDSLYATAKTRQLDVNTCFAKSTLRPDTDQETTDFKKVLNAAVKEQWAPLLILGLFGKDIDHSLYNLSHLMSYADRLNLMGYHPIPGNTPQWIIPLSTSFTLHVPMGTTFSILPMSSLSVSAPDLTWPLQAASLDLANFNVRNKTKMDDTTFTLHQGQGLLIINSLTCPTVTYI